MKTTVGNVVSQVWLRRFTKLTCFSTILLIFAGGLVTSTGSGLSVPDWPNTYGYFMFTFPIDQWVGGIFYEHGHRLIASTVGFFVLVQAFWIAKEESRSWVKKLGFVALVMVIIQGILGGITVHYLLPTAISVSHGILAQTFFSVTIIITYAFSIERKKRNEEIGTSGSPISKYALILFGLIFVQLIIAATMRHTYSGFAIVDFPLSNGSLIPSFDETSIQAANDWLWTNQSNFYPGLFERIYPITVEKVAINFTHRFMALVIFCFVIFLNLKAFQVCKKNAKVMKTIYILDVILLLQITLGALTVWTHKAPYITSLHVANGAAMLGISVLLSLRSLPLTLKNGLFQSESSEIFTSKLQNKVV